MGKFVADSVYDNGLNHVKTNATALILVDSQPVDRAAALAAALATFPLDSSDITLADGDISGRKLTVAGQTGQNATAAGNNNHNCIISATELLIVTTTDAQKAINNGDPVVTSSFDFELRDPA